MNGRGNNVLPNAQGTAMCYSSTGGVTIYIGEYSSTFEVENDVAMLASDPAYATITTDSGGIVAYVAVGGQENMHRKALAPLGEFGFDIN